MILEVKPTNSQLIFSKIGLVLALTFLPLGFYYLVTEASNAYEITFCSFLFLIVEATLFISLVNTAKTQTVVDQEKITWKEGFNTKTLFIKEIEGFWVEGEFAYFIPFDKTLKKIRVQKSYEGFPELISWAEKNLIELRWWINYEEKDEMLQNIKYGNSEDERETRLDLAKGLTKLINILAVLITIFTFWILQFYKVQLLICLALPLLALVLVYVFKGLIRIHSKKTSWSRPSVTLAIFLPLSMVLLRSFVDFSFLNIEAFWFPCSIVFCLVFILILFSLGKEYLVFTSIKTYYALLTIFAISTAYSFGFVSITNVIFDSSPSVRYKVEILDKEIGMGKMIIPYFELNSWELEAEKKEVPVSWELYHYSSIGDSVNVYVRKGFYGLPYYGVN